MLPRQRLGVAILMFSGASDWAERQDRQEPQPVVRLGVLLDPPLTGFYMVTFRS